MNGFISEEGAEIELVPVPPKVSFAASSDCLQGNVRPDYDKTCSSEGFIGTPRKGFPKVIAEISDLDLKHR